MTTATETLDSLPVPAESAPVRARSLRKPAILALALAIAGGGGAYYASQLGLESTDNAQVDAEVIAVPARTSGTIAEVRFTENQRVHAGDLLAVLDDAPARARLAQAEAALEAARAAADAAEADTRVVTSNARGNKALALASLQTSHAG